MSKEPGEVKGGNAEKIEQLTIEAVGTALTEGRRIVFGVVLASLVIGFVALTARMERAAERAALEAELRALGAVINFAELALKDVNAEVLARADDVPTDCRGAFAIIADAQAVLVQQSHVSLTLARTHPNDTTLLRAINTHLSKVRAELLPSPGGTVDTSPIAVLPVSDCRELALGEIVALARATLVRPADLRAEIKTYLDAPEPISAATELKAALDRQAAARAADPELARGRNNADLLAKTLEGRETSLRTDPRALYWTLAETRARSVAVAARLRETEAALAGHVLIAVPLLPIQMTLGYLLWLGPVLLALALAASRQALVRATELAGCIADPPMRRAVLASAGFAARRDWSQRAAPDPVATAVLGVPFVVSLLVWFAYSPDLDIGAHVAMAAGLLLAVCFAVAHVLAQLRLLGLLSRPPRADKKALEP